MVNPYYSISELENLLEDRRRSILLNDSSVVFRSPLGEMMPADSYKISLLKLDPSRLRSEYNYTAGSVNLYNDADGGSSRVHCYIDKSLADSGYMELYGFNNFIPGSVKNYSTGDDTARLGTAISKIQELLGRSTPSAERNIRVYSISSISHEVYRLKENTEYIAPALKLNQTSKEVCWHIYTSPKGEGKIVVFEHPTRNTVLPKRSQKFEYLALDIAPRKNGNSKR